MNIMKGLPAEKLSGDRENQLAKEKTEDAQNELALATMHEAIPYARKVCRAAIPDDELFSLCWVALLKAAKQFRPNKVRFFAYAKVSVRRGICDAWRDKDVVKSASVNEVGYLAHRQISPTTYDGLHADGDYPENLRENTESYGAVLAHEYTTEPTVEPEIDKIDIAERWAVVEPILRAKLSQTEFMTIDLHYRGEMNFQEIAELLGVVREATRLAHIRALKKIRSELLRQGALL